MIKSLSRTVSRSDGLGTVERSPADRPHANLHPHTCRIRPTADPNRARDQLRHVDGISLPDGIVWLPDPCHRWRDRRGPILSQETRVRDDSVGRLRCVRAESGSASRELLGAIRGLALDDLGADVALGRDTCPTLLFLPRDLRLQHPLSPRASPAQGDGQHLDHVRL